MRLAFSTLSFVFAMLSSGFTRHCLRRLGKLLFDQNRIVCGRSVVFHVCLCQRRALDNQRLGWIANRELRPHDRRVSGLWRSVIHSLKSRGVTLSDRTVCPEFDSFRQPGLLKTNAVKMSSNAFLLKGAETCLIAKRGKRVSSTSPTPSLTISSSGSVP
jgi:hypothetical protein